MLPSVRREVELVAGLMRNLSLAQRNVIDDSEHLIAPFRRKYQIATSVWWIVARLRIIRIGRFGHLRGHFVALGRLGDDKSVSERVAVINENCVQSGHAGPAADRGYDRRLAGHGNLFFDPAFEQGTDDRFMDEIVSRLELALGVQLRHAGRSSGAAG